MGDSPTIPALLPLRCGVADLDRGLVHRAGEAIELTPNERAVLATLAARADLVVPREALLAAALGYSPQAVTRTLDMTVRRLRAKIELRPATPEQVLTERGAGYRFVPTPPSAAFSVGEAPIIGRQDELLAMSTGLTEARLLTLVGPAGVGKTRLAQAFADLHAGGFATLGGAWFVDLTDALDEPALIAAVCEALRLEVPADRAQAESRLQARLAALGPALLVLDNFEQLVWSASPRVQRWLAAAPDLRVLVASREALGVAGERVLAIAPLPLADACALLARLAPQSAAGDPALVALAGAVDRLPLMLHLAAGRLAEADADAVTAALARDPATLDPASRLDAAIRSSWNLLIEPERAALAALSVFRGGLPSDGAEAVLGPNWTGLLGVLVDKSLVARAGARHRLLLAVRTFAAARLDERGERTGAELRHARWCAAVGEAAAAAMEGRGEAEGRARLRRERANLVAATERATESEPALAVRIWLSLFMHFANVGPLQQWLDRLEALAAHAGRLEAPLAIRLATVRGQALAHLGRLDEADADFAEAARLADAIGDPVSALSNRRGHVSNLLARQQAEAALAAATALLPQARAVRAHAVEGALLIDQGNALRRLGRSDEAEGVLRRALFIARRVGSRSEESRCLRQLTGPLKARGALEEALQLHREGLDAALAVDEVRSAGASHTSIAYLLQRLERPVEAIAEARLATEQLGRIGASPLVADAWTAGARAAITLCDLAAAEVAIGELAALVETVKHALLLSYLDHLRGLVALLRGDLATAELRIGQAAARMAENGYRSVRAPVIADLACAHFMRGAPTRAEALLAEAVEVAEAVNDLRTTLDARVRWAACLLALSRVDRARDALEGARACAHREPAPRSRAMFDRVARRLELPLLGARSPDGPPWLDERLLDHLLAGSG